MQLENCNLNAIVYPSNDNYKDSFYAVIYAVVI